MAQYAQIVEISAPSSAMQGEPVSIAVQVRKTEWRPLQLLVQHHLRGLWCLV